MRLYPFQQEAVDKLKSQPYALIADQMGLGKSFEALALDLSHREQSPYGFKTLVLCPLSLVEMWRQLYEENTSLKVRTVEKKNRDSLLEVEADVYILHWDAVRLMQRTLSTVQWDQIIADEAQRIQNRKAQVTTATWKVPARYKTALSGTPFTNTPDKMWAVLHWLDRKKYSSYWRFYHTYILSQVTPQGYREIIGTKNEDRLQKEIKPFYVRRLKQDVLKELPPKYYTEIKVDLTDKQYKAYQQMKTKMLAWVGPDDNQILPAPAVVAQFTRLSQFSCAYAEIDATGKVRLTEPSSKLDALMDMITDNPDKQFVVFSQFSQMVDLAVARFAKAGLSYVSLTGASAPAQRPRMVEAFQQGQARIFVGTIAAGGVGITLTAADTVCFLDRTYSPAMNEQAEDRLHRIGQRQAVQVVDFMARGTTDQGRFQRLELKKSWMRKMLGDEL